MLLWLLLLFTLVPAVELYLLIQIGQHLGGVATLALVLSTGALGAALARAEGLRVLRAWQAALEQGSVPADGVVSGVLVLFGGVMLITPGVLTDLFGLSLLVPFVRRPLARYISRRVEHGVRQRTIHVVRTESSFGGGPFPPREPFGPQGVIDVEGESVPSQHEPGGR